MIEKGGFIFTDELPKRPAPVVLTYGDALEGVKIVPNGMINCWITSPPYFGQFSYGVEGQIGLEKHDGEYLDYVGELAWEMLEASSDDATLFWVVRDTYNGSGGLGGDYSGVPDLKERAVRPSLQRYAPRKSQLMIPERTRIAFSDVGWIPILSIIWDKKDSRRGAKDRPSYSYEHILLFSKSPKHYWNREAVLQPFAKATVPQLSTPYTGQGMIDYSSRGLENPSDTKRRMIKSMKGRPGAYLRAIWQIPPGSQPIISVNGKEMRALTAFPVLLAEICVNIGCPPRGWVCDPFCGFGTSNLAASRWGRPSIGIDLNQEYIEAAQVRLIEEV